MVGEGQMSIFYYMIMESIIVVDTVLWATEFELNDTLRHSKGKTLAKAVEAY